MSLVTWMRRDHPIKVLHKPRSFRKHVVRDRSCQSSPPELSAFAFLYIRFAEKQLLDLSVNFKTVIGLQR
ncbi:hypothetical protein N7471_013493 [Penicillium samsonianum]|uniref:uncharacterized protein n=1 Tax=Penicillium samsonianum TaxID=1882272 RepID=UPI0025469584|nr:uncharacterized protein N7471_013493 [Penicillium samsonianum]KAJ6118873.1 hypothetical protein N7471_013493 [Penicillium samsonianum]